MVEKVGAKIESLPTHFVTKDASETTRVMSTVFDSFLDKERQKLNVVVHNLPEHDSPSASERAERDQELFRDIIKEGLNLIIHPTRSFRVGKRSDDKPRLLIVSLENTDTKTELLKMASELRHLSTWKRIYVTPDLTKKEREESKRLREELAARRLAGETDITIRRGRIVRLPANTSEAARASGRKNVATYSTETVPKRVAPSSTEHAAPAQATPTLPIASGPSDHTGPLEYSEAPVSACPVASKPSDEPASEPTKNGNNVQNDSDSRSQD